MAFYLFVLSIFNMLHFHCFWVDFHLLCFPLEKINTSARYFCYTFPISLIDIFPSALGFFYVIEFKILNSEYTKIANKNA